MLTIITRINFDKYIYICVNFTNNLSDCTGVSKRSNVYHSPHMMEHFQRLSLLCKHYEKHLLFRLTRKSNQRYSNDRPIGARALFGARRREWTSHSVTLPCASRVMCYLSDRSVPRVDRVRPNELNKTHLRIIRVIMRPVCTWTHTYTYMHTYYRLQCVNRSRIRYLCTFTFFRSLSSVFSLSPSEREIVFELRNTDDTVVNPRFTTIQICVCACDHPRIVTHTHGHAYICDIAHCDVSAVIRAVFMTRV